MIPQSNYTKLRGLLKLESLNVKYAFSLNIIKLKPNHYTVQITYMYIHTH